MQVQTLHEILHGPAVRKILFMDTERTIQDTVLPHFRDCLAGTEADWTQAVDTMLEVVPRGSSKWSGVQAFLQAAGLQPRHVLAFGDGMNDFEMVLNAGYGVAMGNAKPAVLEVADYITADHDSDGVAQLLDLFLLERAAALK